MESLPLLCLCVLTWSGTNGQKVDVKEGINVVLPCSSNGPMAKGNTFLWKKNGDKKVFNSGNPDGSSQDEEFRGRVSDFPDQRRSGNASITIKKTVLSDSGTYTCSFPYGPSTATEQRIELVVGCILKDRTGENPVACPKPDIIQHKGSVECKAQYTSEEPEVEIRDSAETKIDAEIKKTSENGNNYIILTAVVTNEGYYHCVVTQAGICHEVKTPGTLVNTNGYSGVLIAVIAVLGLFIVGGVVGICCYCKCKKTADSPI